jgi:hypothetical protein
MRSYSFFSLPAAFAVGATFLLSGCSSAADDVDVDDATRMATAAATTTVADAVDTACKPLATGGYSVTTAGVIGLAKQLAQQLVECEAPGTYARLDGLENISLADVAREIPYGHRDAVDGLVDVVLDRPNTTLRINSAHRALPQQYVLWRIKQDKPYCQPNDVALPGRSDHHAGLGFDVDDNVGWRSAMEANDFTWKGTSDKVHFDFKKEEYASTVAAEMKRLTVRAFQKLWNRNNPNDLLAEDGLWGAQTEARLRRSPAAGFPLGPICQADGVVAAVDGRRVRIRVPSGQAVCVQVDRSAPATMTILDESTGATAYSWNTFGSTGSSRLVGRGLGGSFLVDVTKNGARGPVRCDPINLLPDNREGTLECRIGDAADRLAVYVAPCP